MTKGLYRLPEFIMTHILHIDSSPKSERSISRLLTKEFITAWKQAYKNDTVTYRDLGRHLIFEIHVVYDILVHYPTKA